MLLVAALLATAVQAESWCAYPLHAHEWGVQVFDADGHQQPPVAMPAWFHGEAAAAGPEGTPVRDLPADSGVRTLPVVHFYAPARWAQAVPLAVEVGFSQGEAAAWYPQADLLRAADQANGDAARRQLVELREQRAERQPYAGAGAGPLPGDPTAQLVWDALGLSAEPASEPLDTDIGWVPTLRDLDALWVNHDGESERFLFYEADTHERPALRVERGSTWAPDRPHYLLHNDTEHPVHSVLVLAEGGSVGFYAPQIPAGSSAGFLLDGPGPDDPRALIADAITDHAEPEPATDYSWAREDCVMGRDPAVPVTQAEGHRLFEAEVEAIMEVWGERFFETDDTVILYREDTAALAELMPLSIYTDMFHFVELRRLGLVLWQGLDLAGMTAAGS